MAPTRPLDTEGLEASGFQELDSQFLLGQAWKAALSLLKGSFNSQSD